MDDPWGSPWADELHHPISPPDTKARNGPTLAPITPGKDAVTTEKTDRPWDVPGDGFGDWAEVPEVQDITGSGEVAGVSSGWETRGSGDLDKIDASGLSPHWDGSQTGSGHVTPALALNQLPKPAVDARQPSPDPWATAVALSDGDRNKHISEERGQDTEASSEIVVLAQPPPSSAANPHEGHMSELEDNAPSGIAEVTPKGTPKDSQVPVGTLEQVSTTKEADEVSRSSSPSDHSHHDEIPSESPRTSLDEDTHRPHVHRHVSEKIQVLVEHYDGLAKAQLEESVPGEDSIKSDRDIDGIEGSHGKESGRLIVSTGADEKEKLESDEENEDDDDDFGDFEDGHSQISEPILEEKEQVSNALTSHDLDDKSLKDPYDSEAATALPPPTRAPEKDFGRVEYTVDISALGKIYPELKSELPSKDPAEKLPIPDTIPHDSFSSVEQRKTWYRISRYSSLRKHNSGDDDTYVRVNWMRSKVRLETLKIAGRWMEQDRISGRVLLGGDSRDGALFGWNDPKAAPMPLAAAFATARGKKKLQAPPTVGAGSEAPRESPKGAVKPNPSSQSRSPSKQRRRSSTKASKMSEEAKHSVPFPVASFGWNSDSQPVAPLSALDSKPRPVPVNQPSFSQNSTPSSKPQTSSGVLAAIASTKQTPNDLNGLHTSQPNTKAFGVSIPSTTIQNSSHDFNNDWGEMIASPIASSPPQIPPSHKKSQSLIGASLPQSQTLHINAASPSIPLGNSHRATASLDGTSIPKADSPATIPAMSNQIYGNAYTSNEFNLTTNNSAPIANSNYDPWASADFSIFDSAPAPPQKHISMPPPKLSTTQTFKPGTKSVSFESTRAETARQGNGKTRQEVEQDRIVANIVRGLPDLSYMFRR
jgi:hypothetical protein